MLTGNEITIFKLTDIEFRNGRNALLQFAVFVVFYEQRSQVLLYLLLVQLGNVRAELNHVPAHVTGVEVRVLAEGLDMYNIILKLGSLI